MIKRARPKAEIVNAYWYNGIKDRKEIKYICPVCYRRLNGYKMEMFCPDCNTYFDWGDHPPTIVTKYSIQW